MPIIRRPTSGATQRAREVLVAFLFTFIAARVLVYLIMSHRIRDLFLHVGATHVHHLNYGIFLLSFAGAYLLFAQPHGSMLSLTAVLYGIGLGLTFDEFGMWLHLGGSYWQRASFDAVVVIAALLFLIAAAPALGRFRPRHWATTLALLAALALFGFVLADGAKYVGHRLGPIFYQIERSGPQ